MTRQRCTVIQLVDGFATEEQSGGASQFAIQLARHLDRKRYQAIVCGLWRYNTSSEVRWRNRLQTEGIRTTLLVERRRALGTDVLRAAALLKQMVQQHPPVIINSHFERGDVLALCCKLTAPHDCYIVRTMHTDQQWQRRPWLGHLLNLAAFPWQFDAEVAISEATETVMNRRWSARLGKRRAILLRNGISSEFLARLNAVATAAYPTARRYRIAIIGRLEPQKGHGSLLQAVAIMLAEELPVELWVIGTGSLLGKLQVMAADLGIDHAIQFLGQQSDIPVLLGDIDLVVSASLWEGLPTVLLEAMAAAVPVVATSIGGSRELVIDGVTGVLVPPEQPVALAQALRWVLHHPEEARRMALAGQQRVASLTMEKIADGYDDLYQLLLLSTISDGLHTMTTNAAA